MISTVEKVGKTLLKQNDVIEFKKEFDIAVKQLNKIKGE